MIPHSRPTISKQDVLNSKDQIMSMHLAQGEMEEKFCSKLLEITNGCYVKTFSSATAALITSLRTLNVEGRNVLLPSYICKSVYEAIIYCKAIPILYDNAENSWLSSFNEIEKKITSNTAAIIINNTFGIRFPDEDIEKISSLKIPIIADCAHYIGNVNEKVYCTLYSFNATKYLTTGEGGAIVTNNSELYKKLNISKFNMDRGLSDLSASIGVSQLKYLKDFVYNRQEIAKKYFKILPKECTSLLASMKESMYFRFPILVVSANNYLSSTRVAFRRGVDSLLHNIYGESKSSFINSEYIFQRTISIPIYPSLSDNEIEIVINEVKRIESENRVVI